MGWGGVGKIITKPKTTGSAVSVPKNTPLANKKAVGGGDVIDIKAEDVGLEHDFPFFPGSWLGGIFGDSIGSIIGNSKGWGGNTSISRGSTGQKSGGIDFSDPIPTAVSLVDVLTSQNAILFSLLGCISKSRPTVNSNSSDLSEFLKVFSVMFENFLNSFIHGLATDRPLRLMEPVVLNVPNSAFNVSVNNSGGSSGNSSVDVNVDFSHFVSAVDKFVDSVNSLANRPVKVENDLTARLDISNPVSVKFSDELNKSMLDRNAKESEKSDLEIEKLTFDKTAQEVRDIGGVSMVKASPRDVKVMKDVALAKTYADENSLDVEDLDFDNGLDLRKLLEINKLGMATDVTKEFFNL